MVTTKKRVKKGAEKKRPSGKRQSAKKKKGKAAATKAAQLKRRARKGLKAARGGLDTVLQAGERTWKKLKGTIAP